TRTNIEWQRESSLTSTFAVRCWMFDVFPRFRGFDARIFISGKSLLEERVGVRASVISHSFRNDPSAKNQVSCPEEGGDRLLFKNRRPFDLQSGKVRRRKRVLLLVS